MVSDIIGNNMKIRSCFLEALAMLWVIVIVSGCDLFSGGGVVRFSAASVYSGAETKVGYGDDADGYVRLDWISGEDRISISSNLAATESGRSAETYTVTNIDGEKGSKSGRNSYGHLSPYGEGGLLWDEESPKSLHEFWAIHPDNSSLGADGRFSASVKTPNDYLMVAHAPTGSVKDPAGETVTLYFFPAFTAVRLELNCDDAIAEDVTLQNCILSSTNTMLSGTFSAKIATNGDSESGGLSEYTVSEGTHSASAACGNLLVPKKGETSVYVDILCLPFGTPVEDLTLTCEYTIGTNQVSRSLSIPGNLFVARRQHRLKALVLPGDLALVDFVVVSCGQPSDEHRQLPDMTL